MKKLLKKTLQLILPVVLGGFILFWVYRDFDITKVGDVLMHGTSWWGRIFFSPSAQALFREEFLRESVCL